MSDQSMTLYWSPLSPFVRKVMIVLQETGQLEEVARVRVPVALHIPPGEAILKDNPLGKIPVLLAPDTPPLCDSRVICEYLDLRAGTGLVPMSGTDRFVQLRWQALGDGLTDILLLWRTELTRATGPWAAVTIGWHKKVESVLTRLETEAAQMSQTPFGIGQIAVICALGQLDFRWPDCSWRAHFPALAGCEAIWAQRPSVVQSAVPADQRVDRDEVTAGQLRFGLDPAGKE